MLQKLFATRLFQNITYHTPGLQKWGSRAYTKHHYPSLTDADFNRLWRGSRERWSKESRRTFLGTEETRVEAFFYDLAGFNYDRAEKYRCVEGCCLVEWLDGRNQGGFGPAGCPCDALEDPRGELIE